MRGWGTCNSRTSGGAWGVQAPTQKMVGRAGKHGNDLWMLTMKPFWWVKSSQIGVGSLRSQISRALVIYADLNVVIEK